MKKILAVIMLFFLQQQSFSQKNDLGNWLIYFSDHPINERWNLWTEAQLRNYDFGDLQQVLLRTGIGYNLTEKNNNILLGYGYIHSENYTNDEDKVSNVEHRIYQQFIHKNKVGKFALTHRLRWEERFLENDFKMRGRYLLGVNYPLSKEAFAPKTFYLSAYNELFLVPYKDAFDRNRIYGALGFVATKNLKLEVGMMNQSTKNNSRNQLQLVVNHTLPF